MKLLVDPRFIESASKSLDALANVVSASGDPQTAEMLFQQAAGLELASPQLQNCWGGAFNGQSGRQALVLDLLRIIEPAAVAETGAFRGITTEWLATHFSGPVLACEKKRIYYLQAAARLRSFPNVTLKLEDSRFFLREVLATLAPERAILLYLDAHWELDLPLREELRTIFSTHANAVVLVDDFKVPGDSGYTWDDFGPNQALDLGLLQGAIPPDSRVFFPSLPSGQETGAVRGCCVIAREASPRIANSPHLRGAPVG